MDRNGTHMPGSVGPWEPAFTTRCLLKLKGCRALGPWFRTKHTNTARPSIHPFHTDSFAKHMWMDGQWTTTELEFRSPCQVFYKGFFFVHLPLAIAVDKQRAGDTATDTKRPRECGSEGLQTAGLEVSLSRQPGEPEGGSPVEGLLLPDYHNIVYLTKLQSLTIKT